MVVVVKGLLEEWGVVDIFVNNVGIMVDGFFLCMKFEQWQLVFDINFIGIFVLIKEIVKGMICCCYGCIVQIFLVVGFMGNFGQMNYVVLKVGFIGFLKLLVCEIGGCGVMVNVVVLGYIEMVMMEQIIDKVCEELVFVIVFG